MRLKDCRELAFIGALLFVLYLPFANILCKSILNRENSVLLSSFFKALTNPFYMSGLRVSIFVAIVSATASGIAALILLSIEQFFHQGKWSSVVVFLVCLPLLFPDTLLGLIYAIGFKLWEIRPGSATLIIAYSITATGFTYLMLKLFFGRPLKPLIDASKDLGAGYFESLIYVIIPLILKKVAYISLITVITILNEFTIAFFASGSGTQTLPLSIYSSVRYGMKPELFAITGVVVIASLTIFIISTYLAEKGS